MNVGYNEISTIDAARMLKVDKSSVSNWCRLGIINCINVGDGNSKPRYLITEEEVEHIGKCIKKYGKFKWSKRYNKNWNTKEKPVITVEPADENIIDSEQELFLASHKEYLEQRDNKAKEETNTPQKKFDLEKVTTTIAYIQDIKERLEDIEAEKNQLLAELEELRAEVMPYL